MNDSASLYAEIPQDSSVSPILFFIYVSQLFKSNSKLAARLISYSDDIAIVVSSKTFHENCCLLQNAADKLIKWENSHSIHFDMKNTELIHFSHSEKSMKYSVKIMQNRIFSQETVK